jgi:hypothetical protein
MTSMPTRPLTNLRGRLPVWRRWRQRHASRALISDGGQGGGMVASMKAQSTAIENFYEVLTDEQKKKGDQLLGMGMM